MVRSQRTQCPGDHGRKFSNDGVTGLIAGTYVFQLEATDTFGLTGVDTVSVSVHTGSATYTLAPYNNPNEAQWIGIGSTDWGGAGQASKELGAEAWTISGNTVYVRAAFQFDFTTLPTGPAKSAYLTLYSNPTPYTANLSTPNFGTANAFYIQRVNTSWNAATATWSTQPTVDTTGEILIPQTNASALDLTNVDVTGLVNTMIATGNHGFMIRLQNEVIYNSRIFCSSKYSDSTRRPKLVVNY